MGRSAPSRGGVWRSAAIGLACIGWAAAPLAPAVHAQEAPAAAADFRPEAPPEGKGVLYVYRKPFPFSGTSKLWLTIDGNPAGELRDKSYRAITLEPGVHVLGLMDGGKKWTQKKMPNTPMDVSVEAGAVAYVFASYNNSFGWKVIFQDQEAAVALADLAKLKPSP